ncbi:hypothetical protein NFI96_015000, partial [Prochilodus magdalenae]
MQQRHDWKSHDWSSSDEDISEFLHDSKFRQGKPVLKPKCSQVHHGAPPQNATQVQPAIMPQIATRGQLDTDGYHEDSTITLARAIAESINASRLPIPEPSVFSGDPLRYKDWKMSNIDRSEKLSSYRKEVDSLVAWCTKNNLTLNTDKTKEMIVDMRKERRPHQPLFIRDLEVERVSSFKYLGVHISDDLTWTLNTTYVLKRAQQRLYFLRRLRKFGMSPRILSNFYSCIIESILTSCITVWYGSTTVKDRKRLQRVVKTATKITKMAQPSLQSIYNLRVHRRAASIIKDPTHPQHGLFTLLPSGR